MKLQTEGRRKFIKIRKESNMSTGIFKVWWQINFNGDLLLDKKSQEEE